MSAIDKIFVYADWIPLKTPTLQGVLTASHIKGKEAFSFQYDDAWLKSELAEFIVQHGSNVDSDLKELFRRIVFSICISNTDDHLRNHGFLLSNKGWSLSPAYDINPNPEGTGLKLNIDLTDNSLDLDLALEVAEFFRLEKEEAEAIISNIKKIVSTWRIEAKKFQISSSEQDLMETAFDAIL